MSLPFDRDFLHDNLHLEKLAELRRRFMEEWRSGEYTKKEMMEKLRINKRPQSALFYHKQPEISFIRILSSKTERFLTFDQ